MNNVNDINGIHNIISCQDVTIVASDADVNRYLGYLSSICGNNVIKYSQTFDNFDYCRYWTVPKKLLTSIVFNKLISPHDSLMLKHSINIDVDKVLSVLKTTNVYCWLRLGEPISFNIPGGRQRFFSLQDIDKYAFSSVLLRCITEMETKANEIKSIAANTNNCRYVGIAYNDADYFCNNVVPWILPDIELKCRDKNGEAVTTWFPITSDIHKYNLFNRYTAVMDIAHTSKEYNRCAVFPKEYMHIILEHLERLLKAHPADVDELKYIAGALAYTNIWCDIERLNTQVTGWIYNGLICLDDIFTGDELVEFGKYKTKLCELKDCEVPNINENDDTEDDIPGSDKFVTKDDVAIQINKLVEEEFNKLTEDLNQRINSCLENLTKHLNDILLGSAVTSDKTADPKSLKTCTSTESGQE